MKRIYEDLAYSDRPIRDRYWSQFLPDPIPDQVELTGDNSFEFAIVGAGFTGLSAAIHLAEAGASVVVLDAKPFGWGASGRNGGLVSVGSAKLDDRSVIRKFGETDARTFFDAELASVELVEEYLDRFSLDADRHSKGYTYLAHRPNEVDSIREYGEEYQSRYGLKHEFVAKHELGDHGLSSPGFHGAVHVPIGFALNPVKFLGGLRTAAHQLGVELFFSTPVQKMETGAPFQVHVPNGIVRAKKVLICTNGYSSDDMPSQIASRYLPVQSNILVTRPMSENELEAQGWTSEQMCVDSRNLLHYFRLLPDRRMLFGLRGSVRVTEQDIKLTEQKARSDFDALFPAWKDVETEYFWSGLICMTRNLVPFAGEVSGVNNVWGAFGFHGGGVSMAPYAGALIADQALGKKRRPHPNLMKQSPRKFELGRWRRASLPLAFGYYRLKDGK